MEGPGNQRTRLVASADASCSVSISCDRTPIDLSGFEGPRATVRQLTITNDDWNRTSLLSRLRRVYSRVPLWTRTEEPGTSRRAWTDCQAACTRARVTIVPLQIVIQQSRIVRRIVRMTRCVRQRRVVVKMFLVGSFFSSPLLWVRIERNFFIFIKFVVLVGFTTTGRKFLWEKESKEPKCEFLSLVNFCSCEIEFLFDLFFCFT